MQLAEFQKEAAISQKIADKCFIDQRAAQLKLRQKFIDVSDFSKECITKTIRAQNQIDAELLEQSNLKESIAGYQSEIKMLSEFEAKFKEIVENLRPIEKVFQEVINDSDDFDSIEDIMASFEALS